MKRHHRRRNSSLNSRGVVSEFPDNFDEIKSQRMTDDDYKDFLRSWQVSESKNLGDFTMFYVKGDTYQLTDVYEHFIDVFMNLFGLDPSYYISAPHYFQDAMLKVTGKEIPLLTDPDMHLLFEDGKRGGVAMAMKRRMVANNKYMQSYDPWKRKTWKVNLFNSGTRMACTPAFWRDLYRLKILDGHREST